MKTTRGANQLDLIPFSFQKGKMWAFLSQNALKVPGCGPLVPKSQNLPSKALGQLRHLTRFQERTFSPKWLFARGRITVTFWSRTALYKFWQKHRRLLREMPWGKHSKKKKTWNLECWQDVFFPSDFTSPTLHHEWLKRESSPTARIKREHSSSKRKKKKSN